MRPAAWRLEISEQRDLGGYFATMSARRSLFRVRHRGSFIWASRQEAKLAGIAAFRHLSRIGDILLDSKTAYVVICHKDSDAARRIASSRGYELTKALARFEHLAGDDICIYTVEINDGQYTTHYTAEETS